RAAGTHQPAPRRTGTSWHQVAEMSAPNTNLSPPAAISPALRSSLRDTLLIALLEHFPLVRIVVPATAPPVYHPTPLTVLGAALDLARGAYTTRVAFVEMLRVARLSMRRWLGARSVRICQRSSIETGW